MLQFIAKCVGNDVKVQKNHYLRCWTIIIFLKVKKSSRKAHTPSRRAHEA